MLLSIFIFCIIVLILSVNIHLYLVSEMDTIKIIIKIGVFEILIPHQRLLSKLLKNKNKYFKSLKSSKHKTFIFKILSHSIIDYAYIAKYSKKPIYSIPIENGIYLSMIGFLIGVLHCQTKNVIKTDLRLKHISSYENVDYYFDAHMDVISFMWASIISLQGGKHATSNR
ncbi:MAG: hypothetical protein ACI35S_07070 [Anaeroplasma sp.]